MIKISKEKLKSLIDRSGPGDQMPEGLWLINNALSSGGTHVIIANDEFSLQLFPALDVSNKRFGIYDITNDTFTDIIQTPIKTEVIQLAGDPVAGDHLDEGQSADFHNTLTGVTSRWANISGSLKSIQY